MNPPEPSRAPIQNLGRSIVTFVVVLSGGFVAIMLWGAFSVVEKLSEGAIDRSTRQIEVELARFFDPVERNLDMAMRWGAEGELDPANIGQMNKRFIPLLQAYPQISSMLVTTPQGVEYMLLREKEGWVNRSTDATNRPGVTKWSRWSDAATQTQTWEKELDYDPRLRPWFLQARDAAPGEVSWTEPYVFFTTKDPGITASSRVQTPGGELTIALDVMLLDISEFTTELDVSDHGKATVLTESLAVLGLPRSERFGDPEVLKRSVLAGPHELGVPGIATAVDAWKSGQNENNFSFTLDGANWLAGFRSFPLGSRQLWIGVAVPAADFKGQSTEQRVALFLLALIGILTGAVLAVMYTRRSVAEIERAVGEVQRQLGQYQLDRKIGQGGMGTVFRGRHVLMRRPTAVKILRPDRANAEFAKRFEREVRLSCKLTHPNTIAIYDYGRTPEGTFYYAMELLNGTSLATLLDVAGPLGDARTIYLLRQICGSLREAHSIGLIHRDIKPGNLHVCERGGRYDFMKVLDFGLVKDTASTEQETLLTQETSYGTPGFVAPEAIRDSSKATVLSDIYAVGTVAYAMLTAQTIFVEMNRVKMLLRQMREDPVPPSERLGRPVAPDLERIVMQCVARDPGERPQSMQEILDALNRCADADGWNEELARAWWMQHPELLGLTEESSPDASDTPPMPVDVVHR